MPPNTWNNSQANNDGNDPLNWSLGHVPTTGETATWGATSVVDCDIASATIVCLDINVATAYSGLITLSGGRDLQTTNGGASSIDGRVFLNQATSYLYITGSGSLSLGANAVISGVGYIYINSSTAGITSNAGATVSCGRIFYNTPRVGSSIAAGTYACDLHVLGHVSITSYRDFQFAAGSFSFEDVKFTSPGTVALQVDAGTHNPSITITGDWTIDSDGVGGVTWSASSNAIELEGGLIDEVVAGTFTAGSQDITLSGGNADIDPCGGTWGTVTVNAAGTKTLSGTLTCGALTGTAGTLDTNGQDVTASGAVTFASGFTVADPAGSTIACDTFEADGQTLNGSATWNLNCTTSGTLTGVTITNCDASGGVEIDASDGTCTDGGGNTNINFGGEAPSLFRGTFSPAFVGAFG
jgi:hypothetical protein